jgi:hypothetical protein
MRVQKTKLNATGRHAVPCFYAICYISGFAIKYFSNLGDLFKFLKGSSQLSLLSINPHFLSQLFVGDPKKSREMN